MESDDGDGIGSEGQSTVAMRERLGTEMSRSRSGVPSWRASDNSDRCTRESWMGNVRLEKATTKVALRRKELSEAEEQLCVAHAKRDKAFYECETAQEEELRAKQGQSELLRQFHGADLFTGGCWTEFGKCSGRAGSLFPT